MDLRARDVLALPGGRMRFVVDRPDGEPLPVELNLAGEHNVRTALAAFAGVGRRFQRFGDLPARHGGTFTLIDDYGHHPVEMAAVLSAARGAFPGRRLVLAFQPHRYSRTRDCLADFVRVLGQADALWLTEVYAAGEAPIAGADGGALAHAASAAGCSDLQFCANVRHLPALVAEHARAGDVVITMGAGAIGAVPQQVVALMHGAAGTAQ